MRRKEAKKKKKLTQPLGGLNNPEKEILSCQSHLSFPHAGVAMATPRASIKVGELKSALDGESYKQYFLSSSKEMTRETNHSSLRCHIPLSRSS